MGVDKERLIQVISNVMNDAIKFTNDGTITVTIKVKKKGVGKEEDPEIIVSIKGPGSGIDREMMPKLFSKFATKSHRGSGLGLYVSQNIVEAHGAKIWGENNKYGKGATFTFTLPFVS